MSVLVAYDGSEESRAALLWALRETPLAEAVRPVAVLVGERSTRRIVSAWDTDGADLRDVAELRVARGHHPAETLSRIAEEEGAALIVVGHHRGRHVEALRPSVAEDLLRLAPCPVVVVAA